MAKKRDILKDSMQEGLKALITPSTAVNPEPESKPAPTEPKKYKTYNYVTDPSHHTRLKRYATDQGISLMQAFNEAIDVFLSDKGEIYQ